MNLYEETDSIDVPNLGKAQDVFAKVDDASWNYFFDRGKSTEKVHNTSQQGETSVSAYYSPEINIRNNPESKDAVGEFDTIPKVVDEDIVYKNENSTSISNTGHSSYSVSKDVDVAPCEKMYSPVEYKPENLSNRNTAMMYIPEKNNPGVYTSVNMPDFDPKVPTVTNEDSGFVEPKENISTKHSTELLCNENKLLGSETLSVEEVKAGKVENSFVSDHSQTNLSNEDNDKDTKNREEIVGIVSARNLNINDTASHIFSSSPSNDMEIADAFSMILDVVSDEGIFHAEMENDRPINNTNEAVDVSSAERDSINSIRQSYMPDLVPIDVKPFCHKAVSDENLEKIQKDDTKSSSLESLANPSELLEDLMTSITTVADITLEVSI